MMELQIEDLSIEAAQYKNKFDPASDLRWGMKPERTSGPLLIEGATSLVTSSNS